MDGGGFPVKTIQLVRVLRMRIARGGARSSVARALYIKSTPTPLSPDPLDATAEPMGCSIANRRRLRVFAQCKAEKRKMGPAYLRELEGVVYRHATTTGTRIPTSFTPTTTTTTAAKVKAKEQPSPSPPPPPPPPPIALLVSESAFTRNCLLAAHASPLPFLLVHLPPHPSGGGSGGSGAGGAGPIGAIFGNPALVSAKGVLGGDLEIRWERGGSGGGGGGGGGGVVTSSSSGVLPSSSGCPKLWWQGQPLPSWTPDADGGVVL